MGLYVWGFLSTLVFKSFMTMGGVGAAFVLVPIFYWLGMPFPEAAATGLMLGVLNTGVASYNYAKDRLVNFRVAVFLIVAILIFSPLGVYFSDVVNKNILLIVFAAFLLVAGSMMLFYHPKKKEGAQFKTRPVASSAVGSVVGFLSGLLGVGGGGFLGPFLVWLGMDGKEVAGTTAFVVMFSSLIGFAGHVGLEFSRLNYLFLALTAVAALSGGVIGSWLTRFKLTGEQVKQVIGIVQYMVAAKIIFDLAVHIL
ncbi:MAG: sulfite exporter TauE/SafE family protein [Syntrophobacteraceae bacterium]